MGSVCLGRHATAAPAAPAAAKPVVVMRGPEGLRVPVTDEATVEDLLRATRLAGCPARSLTFCYEPMPLGARLADLGICDDAEFGVAPCHHWRLHLRRRSTRYDIHCADCDAWADANPAYFIGVDPRRIGAAYRGAEGAASLIVSWNHSRDAVEMLTAWNAARTLDALAVCQHPLAWRYTTSTMTCMKCMQECPRVYYDDTLARMVAGSIGKNQFN